MSYWQEYTGRKCWTINWFLPPELKREKLLIQQLLIEAKKGFDFFFATICDKHNLILLYGDGPFFKTGFKSEVVLNVDMKSTELKEFLDSCGLFETKVWSKCKTLGEEESWLDEVEGQSYPKKIVFDGFPFDTNIPRIKMHEVYNTFLKTSYRDPSDFKDSYKKQESLFERNWNKPKAKLDKPINPHKRFLDKSNSPKHKKNITKSKLVVNMDDDSDKERET